MCRVLGPGACLGRSPVLGTCLLVRVELVPKERTFVLPAGLAGCTQSLDRGLGHGLTPLLGAILFVLFVLWGHSLWCRECSRHSFCLARDCDATRHVIAALLTCLWVPVWCRLPLCAHVLWRELWSPSGSPNVQTAPLPSVCTDCELNSPLGTARGPVMSGAWAGSPGSQQPTLHTR